ncbi:MAG: hypothetical protein WCG80_05625 [Spirochaetales bacterium]
MKSSQAVSPLWHDVTGALRANFLPGVVLWLLACTVVGSYFLWDQARPFFDTLGAWKSGGGFLYSIVATSIFAGLIPWVVLRLLPGTRSQATASSLVFLVVFWAYRGLEMDAFYRLQGLMFGNDGSLGSIAAKVLFDQFVYNVFWAGGYQLLAYHWKDSGFRLSAFRGYDWKGLLSHRLPVLLVSTWLVWFPVAALMYSLPADLQIPVFNLVACFWSLVVATLTKPKASAAPKERAIPSE